MPFLLAFLPGLLKSKVFWYGLAAVALLAAAAWGVHHLENIGAAKAIAEEQAKTQAEHQRREDAIAEARQQADADAAKLQQSDQRNADLIAQINRLSAARDSRACLSRPAVERLRAIGAPRPEAGH